MVVLGELGVEVAEGMGVEPGTINSATVQEILKAAMDLCEETNYYETTIQPAIDGIKKIPDLIK
jgi:hypothetical protein